MVCTLAGPNCGLNKRPLGYPEYESIMILVLRNGHHKFDNLPRKVSTHDIVWDGALLTALKSSMDWITVLGFQAGVETSNH